MTPKLITAAERAARRGQPAPAQPSQPVAQFRVKGGCKTCNPIPVYPRPVTVDQSPK